MFTATLSTIVKIWKQPRCPSANEWIKKILCVYTHTYMYIQWSTVAVVQSLSCIWLFETPWTAAHQASLFFTISQRYMQVSKEAGKVVWYSHLFQNFPQFVVIHTVKGFCIVNEAKTDVFLEFSCSLYDPTDVGNLISGSSAFSQTNLNIWEFSIHVLLKPSLKNFEHYFASVWNECNCVIVWTFFGIIFLWD